MHKSVTVHIIVLLNQTDLFMWVQNLQYQMKHYIFIYLLFNEVERSMYLSYHVIEPHVTLYVNLLIMWIECYKENHVIA